MPHRIEDQAIIDLEAVPQPFYLIKRGAAAALVYTAYKLSLKLTFGVAGQLHYVLSQIEMVKGEDHKGVHWQGLLGYAFLPYHEPDQVVLVRKISEDQT